MDEQTRKLLDDIRKFMDDVLKRHEDKRIYWLPDDVKGHLRKYRFALGEILVRPDEAREILDLVLIAWASGDIPNLPESIKSRIHKLSSSPRPPQDN